MDAFFVDRSDREHLYLTGRDHKTFLQGMVTNDVVSLVPGQGCYAFMLDATGHVLADMHIFCCQELLILDVEPGMGEFVRETLEKYLIMEKCRISPVSGPGVQFLIGGTDAPKVLENMALGIEGAEQWQEGQGVLIHIVDEIDAAVAAYLPPTPAFDLYKSPIHSFDDGKLRCFLQIWATEITAEDLEIRRIAAGVPRFGMDIDSRVLAPETGQAHRAISYKKGCYIGQEIIARIDARGRTNRTFAGFRLTSSALPARETPIFAADKEVGRVTSAAFLPRKGQAVALGYIRNEHAAVGTEIVIAGLPAVVAATPSGDE